MKGAQAMKNLTMLLLILILATFYMTSKEVGGKNLSDNLKIENNSLFLNGAGVIKKFFFKIYAIGLYLPSKSNDSKNILKTDKAMSLKLHFIRNDIDVSKIQESWDEGFKKSTGGNTAGLNNEIKQFKSCFTNNIKEDDTFQFDYLPGSGTKIYVNKQLKATITGVNFKSALFGIWLGDDPRDDGVKDKLLGK